MSLSHSVLRPFANCDPICSSSAGSNWWLRTITLSWSDIRWALTFVPGYFSMNSPQSWSLYTVKSISKFVILWYARMTNMLISSVHFMHLCCLPAWVLSDSSESLLWCAVSALVDRGGAVVFPTVTAATLCWVPTTVRWFCSQSPPVSMVSLPTVTPVVSCSSSRDGLMIIFSMCYVLSGWVRYCSTR